MLLKKKGGKWTYEEAKECFSILDYKLLSKEFTTTGDKYDVECPNGHLIKINLKGFNNDGRRCKKCADNKRKTPFEEVKKAFDYRNYTLLATDYKNNHSLLSYRCENDHLDEISFASLSIGSGCKLCFNNDRRYSFEYINGKFLDLGYTLLEFFYQNAKTKLTYYCCNNHLSQITMNSINANNNCKKCADIDKSLSYDFVKQQFTNDRYELLQDFYENNYTLIPVRCDNDHLIEINYGAFQQGQRCVKCFNDTRRFKYDDIKRFYEINGCKLLETEYVSVKTNMKFICVCGLQHSSKFTVFQKGHRCTQCGYDKLAKRSTMFKDYIMPSGDIRRIQGYEHLALDILVKKYPENDIFTVRREMPEIFYEYKDKKRRYIPDIWIKSSNTLIEVKSVWIYGLDIEQNHLKADASKKNYNFEFWIYEQKNNKKIKEYNKTIIVW